MGKKKNVTSDKGASLARFFRDLKTRAGEAEKTPADKRSEEQKLYISAWQQCDNQKLTVDGDTLKINGKVATGGDVEQKMKGEMGKGALRRYQLVAALDWIETFKATLVRPGGNGIGFVGHGYEDVAGGTGAHLKSSSATADYTFDLAAPDDAVTVGDLFSAEKSLAAAVILGVNRPHYVETALWRALNPAGDVKTEAETHLAALVQALDVPAPPGKKSKKKAKRTITQADIAGLDDAAKAHYETLRRLIWPSAADSASVNEEQLLAEFERQALPLYKAADARKFRRAERFGTVEAAFESPAWNK